MIGAAQALRLSHCSRVSRQDLADIRHELINSNDADDQAKVWRNQCVLESADLFRELARNMDRPRSADQMISLLCEARELDLRRKAIDLQGSHMRFPNRSWTNIDQRAFEADIETWLESLA